MRSLHTLLLGVVALTSCASKPVHIAADRCWSVSEGDKVEGTAILYAYSGPGGSCIECGAMVRGENCPAVGFVTANDAVDQVYNRIIHAAPADDLGFVRQIVNLSGEVTSNEATGKLTIRATHLRIAPAGGS